MSFNISNGTAADSDDVMESGSDYFSANEERMEVEPTPDTTITISSVGALTNTEWSQATFSFHVATDAGHVSATGSPGSTVSN
jgi:hypothetical protein